MVPLVKPRSAQHSRRGGFSAIEALVALTILSVCATYFIWIALWHLEHGVRLRRRALALEHTSNVLEAIRNRSWEALQADVDEQQPVPDSLARRLPEGSVRIRIGPFDAGGRAARRISVEVQWLDPKQWKVNQTKPSIELVAFRGR
jgi:prepilin-type N-terminal cleavage/methylation domain-containing protein